MWKPIEDDLRSYFFAFYWADIMEALKEADVRVNSKNQLIDGIRTGRIRYSNGVFTGDFNVSISRYLSQFAKYDARSGVWRGAPPGDVSAAAAVANERARALNQKIDRLISEIPARVSAEVDRLKYSIDQPLFAMSRAAEQDLETLGIRIDVTPELSQRLIDNYTTNQNLNIVNWTPDQVERLRGMVERDALAGYNRYELAQTIANEFNVTMNKAKFLARQETNLFMTEVRDERYSDAGIEIVQWSNSGDVRVVGNPAGPYEPSTGHGNHWIMGGKYCKLSDPTVYADTLEDARAGRWKSKSMIGAGTEHAGREYNCRCTYKPVIV
jgi:hypothetical protein